MMHWFSISWIVVLWPLLLGGPAESTVSPAKTAQIDPCQVFGAIYIEEYPENAQFLVYEEESEAFARIQIFEEDNRLMANETGKWYFTDTRDFARYSVYFVEKKINADFSVYFTDFESFAGCRK